MFVRGARERTTVSPPSSGGCKRLKAGSERGSTPIFRYDHLQRPTQLIPERPKGTGVAQTEIKSLIPSVGRDEPWEEVACLVPGGSLLHIEVAPTRPRRDATARPNPLALILQQDGAADHSAPRFVLARAQQSRGDRSRRSVANLM